MGFASSFFRACSDHLGQITVFLKPRRMLAYSVAKINTIQCLPFATLWGPEEKQEKEKRSPYYMGILKTGVLHIGLRYFVSKENGRTTVAKERTNYISLA